MPAPYFAVDTDHGLIQDERGDTYSIDQFRKVVERGAEKGIFYDMTQMTARFVRMGYDLDALNAYYDEAQP